MTVTPNTDPVFSIEQGEYVAPIGAMGENVYINIGSTETPSYITLDDFYSEWKNFKEQAKFIQYGVSEPNSESVKACYYTPIINLTNTVWLLNDWPNITITNDNLYNLNFSSNNNAYSQLSLSRVFAQSLPIPTVKYDNTMVYQITPGVKWIDQVYRTITITGGTDVTNSDLIDWLYNNATLIED